MIISRGYTAVYGIPAAYYVARKRVHSLDLDEFASGGEAGKQERAWLSCEVGQIRSVGSRSCMREVLCPSRDHAVLVLATFVAFQCGWSVFSGGVMNGSD